MMRIDFEDVHDVTGWSTEDVDHLVLHKKLPRLRLNETRFGPRKSRPRYISAQNISTLFDALDEREIAREFSDSRAFMAVPAPVLKGHIFVVLS
jgi:hypothetical protein